MRVDFKLLLTENDKIVLSKGKYLLLKYVLEEGSLNSAAKKMKISYKKAFSYIKSIEEGLDDVVLLRTPGKAAILSDKGIEIIKLYDYFYNELNIFLKLKMDEYEKNRWVFYS